MLDKNMRLKNSLVHTDLNIVDLVMEQREILLHEEPFLNGKERLLLQKDLLTGATSNARTRLSAGLDSGLLQKGYKQLRDKALIKNMLVRKQIANDDFLMNEDVFQDLDNNDLRMN